MTEPQTLWLFYTLTLGFRVFGSLKRWRMPRARGENFFFHIPVGPEFYTGAGRPILRRYLLWILAGYLPDLVAAPWIAITGATRYLPHLIVGGMIAGVFCATRGALLAARAAKPLAVTQDPPVERIAFSLATRHSSDYTNWRLEIILAAATLVSFAALARVYYADPEPQPFLNLFRAPLLLLYMNLGVLLVKRGIVAARTAAPADDAEAYLAWREAMRRRYLFLCDAVRTVWTATLVAVSAAHFFADGWEPGRFRTLMVGIVLVMSVGWAAWYHRQAKGVVQAAFSRRPVTFPAPQGAEDAGALCYRPSSPLSFIRTNRGFTVNVGSRRIQWAVAWVGGLVLLVRL